MKNFIYTRPNKFNGIKNAQLTFGTWGLQSTVYANLSEKHIQSIHSLLSKQFKKIKNYRININLNKINTKKPLEIRMGGGKGNLSNIKTSSIKPGHILVEISSIPYILIYSLLKHITYKLSIKLRLIKIK